MKNALSRLLALVMALVLALSVGAAALAEEPADDPVLATYDGEPITIGFKSTFLVEILANTETPTVQIELADSTRAGVFKPVYDDKQNSDTLMLLMPMMINA